MKRYLSYCTVLLAMLFASCMDLEEGLDQADALVVSVNKIEMDASGGEKTIDIDSYCSWNVVSTEDWDWISTTAKKGKKGQEKFKLILSENLSVENRSATVTIENKVYDLFHQIEVTQKGGSAYITPAKEQIDATSDGLKETLSISSNIDYTIASDADWCKIDEKVGECGKFNIVITVDPSPSTSKREATITFKSAEHNCESKIKVSQKAFEPSVELSDIKITSNDLGAEKDFTVISNIPWTATCNATWVKLTPINGKLGTNSVKVTIEKNAETTERTATIVVSNEEYKIEKEIKVEQNAIVPEITLSENTFSLNEDGGSKEFTVDANITWNATCSANWVQITPASGKSGKSSLKITISENLTTDEREATITVSNSYYKITKEIKVSQIAFDPSLEVSDKSINSTEDGLTKNITVNSNISWKAACNASWVHISMVNGDEGTSTVKITIDKNATTSARSAKITVSNSTYNITREINVEQMAFGPNLLVSENAIAATTAGETKNITVTSNVEWTVSCSAKWVTIVKGATSNGNTTLKVTVDKNATVEARETKIVLKNEEYSLTKEISVTQAAFVPELSISETSFAAKLEGATKGITVESNITWKATCDASWVTLSAANGNTGTSTINITVDRNITTQARSAKVYISNDEYDINHEISISQVAFEPSLVISSNSYTLSTNDGGEKSITVTSNVHWTASCTADWLSYTPVDSDESEATMKITVQKNTTTAARTATIEVKNEQYGLSKTITVTQAAFTPVLDINSNTFASTCLSTEKSISVTSNVSWNVACEANWITVTPVTGTSSTKTVKITTKENSTTSARTANVTIKNDEYNLSKVITVTQEAFAPSLTISDSAYDPTCSSSSKTITITSNIPWTATDNASWVSLNKSSGSAGTTSMSISVQANETTSARTAKVQITNTQYSITREITISQEAFTANLSVSETSVNASCNGEVKNVTVNSNITWTATSNVSWITLSPVNGNGGQTTLSMTVANNAVTSSRTGKVTVKNTQYNLTKEILVNQAAFAPELSVNGSNVTLDFLGSTKFVKVNSNVEYTGTTTADWITIENAEGGLNLIYETNSTGSTSRSAEIVVTADAYSTLSATFTVTQAGFSDENVIRYTSTGKMIVPSSTADFGAEIIAVTFENGEGEIRFDGPVTKLSSNVFSYNTHLTTITLPSSLTEIGSDAFRGCSALSEINATGSLTKIGSNAFNGCTNLTELNISGNALTIGTYAFSGCNMLENITFDGTISSIEGYAFSGCSKIESLELPVNNATIGSYIANGCSSLKNVEFTGTVETLGEYAFNAIGTLETISFDGNLGSIGNRAFYNCASLSSVTFGGSLTSIGQYAFYNCDSIESIELPDGLTTISSSAFDACSKLEEVVLPESINTIGSYAFQNCSYLQSINIPSGVTSINNYTFYNCVSLENINIPSGVTNIGNYAFYKCVSMDTIILPNTLTSIGQYAFAECSLLSTVVSLNPTPPYGGNSMFYNNKYGRKIYVPVGAGNTYESASYWYSYSSYIYEFEYTPTECTSLSITAEDVTCDETTTTITYSAITNGTISYGSTVFGELEGLEMTGTVTSETFDANTTEEDIERTVSYTYMTQTATATFTHKGVPTSSYTVNLNSQWRQSTSITNPNSSLYDGVYESYSNYYMNSQHATMYIDIEGYEEFTIYIRSYAESTFDYVMVSQLDQTITGSTSYSSTLVKAHTRGAQQSGTSISYYTPVKFTGIDGNKHRITIVYRKDGSGNSYDDRGYVLIPKNQ